MIKFIRKKIIEGLIKDLVKELPEIKDKALSLLAQNKDKIIEKIKDAIKKEIRVLVEKA